MRAILTLLCTALVIASCNGLLAPDQTRVACGENPVVYVGEDENAAQVEQFYHTVYQFWKVVPESQARPQLLTFPGTGFLKKGAPIEVLHGGVQYDNYALLSAHGSHMWTHRTEICPR